MAKHRQSLEDPDLQGKYEEPQLSSRSQSFGSLSVTSDYSSLKDQPGDNVFMQHSGNNKGGNMRTSGFQKNEVITEKDAWELSKDISQHVELAMELKLSQAEIKEIEDDKNGRNSNREKAFSVLMKFMQKEGSNATKGHLSFALDKAGRRDLAEKLIEFPGKNQGQDTFIVLKEKACFKYKSGEIIKICEDKDGTLCRFQKCAGYECELYLKLNQAIQETGGTLAEFVDPKESPNLELERKPQEELEEQLRMLAEGGLKMVQNTLERQERQGDKIEIGLQLDEDEKQIDKMHVLAEAACHLQEPFVPKSQIYDLSITLSAVVKDLEERARMLSELTVSDEEALRLSKLLVRCHSLRNVMDEKIYMGSLKDFIPQMRKREHLLSAPTQSLRARVSDSSIPPRLNTMPKSEREQRELKQRISPPKDPLEEEDGCTTKF